MRIQALLPDDVRLRSSWNKGMPQMEAFGTAQTHHGQPDFMRLLNNPAMLEGKKNHP